MDLKKLEAAAEIARQLDMIHTMQRSFSAYDTRLLRLMDSKETPSRFSFAPRGIGVVLDREDMAGFLTTLELKYRTQLRQLGVDA